MKTMTHFRPLDARRAAVAALILLLPPASPAQTLPAYDHYTKLSKALTDSVKMPSTNVTWKDGGAAVEFALDGQRFRYDLAGGNIVLAGKATEEKKFGKKRKTQTNGKAVEPKVERGRVPTSATAPDGKHKAFYRDANVWLSDPSGDNTIQVSTDGDATKRIRNGTASWVYGEELFQHSALWWSHDGKKLAYYRFDESKVPDYYLTLDQAALHSKLDVEPYPEAGANNPVVDVMIYDLENKQTVRADIRDGQPFANAVVGYYAYNVSWSKDNKELLFFRTNRRQNIMELAACDVPSGRCRVIVKEEWPASWVENLPTCQFLKDQKRFVWESERTGFKNYYLYDLTGKLLVALTHHEFEVAGIVRIDEKAGVLYYLARSGDNHMKLQLHRVGLDGTGDQRLTDPAYQHSVDLAPDGKHFIDVKRKHDVPPVLRLVANDGKLVTELALSDTTRFDKINRKRVELYDYLAADGTTHLQGMLHFPTHFDAKKKYPLLVTVYAGPATNRATENFTLPSALTEYGFLVASLDSRSAAGRGKKFLDAIYQKLGVPEIDDQAAGVRALWDRPYVNKERVGIFGASYGGYASLLCLLRHPDVFQAACASSSVTDFRRYDSIYTERYLWLPSENQAGYDAGSALKLADKLQGRLMLYYGTADNNVHPSNTLALIRALQRAGKSFEVQVGPDQGHGALAMPRMLEFFVDNLARK